MCMCGANPPKDETNGMNMCQMEAVVSSPAPIEISEASYYEGYVGGFHTDAPTEFMSDARQQECGSFKAHSSCDLTNGDEEAFNECRELILTEYVNNEVSTPDTAFNVFWRLPRDTQINFLLRNSYSKRRMQGLVYDKFFDGTNVQTTDEKVTLMEDAFSRKMAGMTYDQWSVLSLSGVLYLLGLHGNDSAGKFCASKTNGVASEICDADLDDKPDANDQFPFRPHDVPTGDLEGVYNGQKMAAGVSYYLCIEEVDPYKKNGIGALLSSSQFIDDKTNPHYYTTTKLHFLPEHDGIRGEIPAFEKRVEEALHKTALTFGKYPVELDPQFADENWAWHTVFVTKTSKCTHGFYFKTIFERYDTAFLSLDVSDPVIVHEVGGHLMFGIDDRYVDHGGSEWFEPHFANGVTHSLHSPSLIASPCSGDNIMGAAASENTCETDSVRGLQCPIKDLNGNITAYSNNNTFPVTDAAASMAMTSILPCPPSDTPNFLYQFSGVTFLHVLFSEMEDATKVMKHYTEFSNDTDASAIPLQFPLLLKDLEARRWDNFKYRFQRVLDHYKMLIRERNFAISDPDFLVGLGKEAELLHAHRFDMVWLGIAEDVFSKEKELYANHKNAIAGMYNSLPRRPDTFSYFMLYAISKQYPAAALEPIYAHQNNGSWFRRESDIDMESLTQMLLMFEECATKPAMDTAIEFLTAFAQLPEDEYKAKYAKGSEVFFKTCLDIYETLLSSDMITANRQTFIVIFTRALDVMGYRYKKSIEGHLRFIQY